MKKAGKKSAKVRIVVKLVCYGFELLPTVSLFPTLHF